MSSSVARTRTKTKTLVDEVRQTAVDEHIYRFRRRLCLIVLAVIALVVIWAFWRFKSDRPVDYADVVEHYKYGSLGSEPGGSLFDAHGGLLPPYWIFKVLPDICPDMLPGGYASLGFLFEPGKDMPIGVSRRFRLGFDQVGVNCAVCHTGTYRESPGSETQIVLGMPAHQLYLQEFFEFVLGCTLDERFTPENVVGKIQDAGGNLNFVDRLLYRNALIPRTREQTLVLRNRLGLIMGGSDEVTRWGAGRVDTFNPYKAIQFNWRLTDLPPHELIGASDYPSIWNQKPRDGMQLHWDGNNDSVDERNLSASLGTGVTPTTIDHERLERVKDWIWTLPPPQYPFEIDQTLAATGAPIYDYYCAECHAFDGKQTGKVVPIAKIGTDPYRLNSYTYHFAANQYTLYPSSKYSFKHFRKTDGYANHPLDGLWAKAPYLHNGSVPTLRDLLEPPENRPAVFYRGYDVFDQDDVGFVHDVPAENGKSHFRYDTSRPGNGNGGHLYGVELSAGEKDALVEYMKTL